MHSHDYPSAWHKSAALAPFATARRLSLELALLAFSTVAPSSATALPPAHPAPRPESALHDIHLTYSRVVVDGASVIFRVRLFHDDLEKALQLHTQNPALKVGPNSPTADSAFASYFNARVPVKANGKRLVARVIQSGKDMDVTDQEMWWYLVELTAPAPVTVISMRVELLFEHYTDQKNIVTMLKMPGERRYSLYFVREDEREQRVIF